MYADSSFLGKLPAQKLESLTTAQLPCMFLLTIIGIVLTGEVVVVEVLLLTVEAILLAGLTLFFLHELKVMLKPTADIKVINFSYDLIRFLILDMIKLPKFQQIKNYKKIIRLIYLSMPDE